jgi:hypothetical protein
MANTITGAVMSAMAALTEDDGSIYTTFPGGIHKEAAAHDRPGGTFLVISNELNTDNHYTSVNRVGVFSIEMHVYASGAAVAAAALLTFMTWFNSFQPELDNFGFLPGGKLVADGPQNPTETTDYAPKQHGGRMYQASVTYRCWISCPTR